MPKGLRETSQPDLRSDTTLATDASEEPKPGYLGHRERLRARFLNAGADSLPDYELLELLLFSALPRRDTKPIAKALIQRFGSFGEVISAPADI